MLHRVLSLSVTLKITIKIVCNFVIFYFRFLFGFHFSRDQCSCKPINQPQVYLLNFILTKASFVWYSLKYGLGVRVMVFNTTFNNISATSQQSVLLVEETEVPRENHRPAASQWQTLSSLEYEFSDKFI